MMDMYGHGVGSDLHSADSANGQWLHLPGELALQDFGRPSSERNGRFYFRSPIGDAVVSQVGNGSPYRRNRKMARLEAVLLVAEGALTTRKLVQLGTLVDAAEVRALIDQLNEMYDASGSSFRVERVAAGYQLLTRPEFSFWMQKLHQRQAQLKLSPPAMETLSIVAYRQPIVRADIEAIRGVQSSEMLKQLMERGLVRIAGEDDSLGRPYLYGTTRRFLELFGLRNLDQLPMAEELKPVKRDKKAAAGEVAESPDEEADELDIDDDEIDEDDTVDDEFDDEEYEDDEELELGDDEYEEVEEDDEELELDDDATDELDEEDELENEIEDEFDDEDEDDDFEETAEGEEDELADDDDNEHVDDAEVDEDDESWDSAA